MLTPLVVSLLIAPGCHGCHVLAAATAAGGGVCQRQSARYRWRPLEPRGQNFLLRCEGVRPQTRRKDLERSATAAAALATASASAGADRLWRVTKWLVLLIASSGSERGVGRKEGKNAVMAAAWQFQANNLSSLIDPPHYLPYHTTLSVQTSVKSTMSHHAAMATLASDHAIAAICSLLYASIASTRCCSTASSRTPAPAPTPPPPPPPRAAAPP